MTATNTDTNTGDQLAAAQPQLTIDAPDGDGPAPIEIAGLAPGERVDGLLACARKAVVTSPRTGTTFLVAVLRDGERKVQARAFERVHELAGRFERGDIVRVRGHVTTYDAELQIRIEQIERHASTPPAELLPAVCRNVEEHDGFLEQLVREVHDRDYRVLLESLLECDELRREWRIAPCLCTGQHAHFGGLLEHTVTVGRLACELCQIKPRLDGDLLLTAALVHDVGETRAFTYTRDVLPSEEGRMLGHVQLGLEILQDHGCGIVFARHKWQALAHCVLLHHGSVGLVSPAFASAEAHALQRLVALDEGGEAWA